MKSTTKAQDGLYVYDVVQRLYNWRTRQFSGGSGISWLQQFKAQYPHLIWLNPEPKPKELNFWTQTYLALADLFPMYDLSVDGLEAAMKYLIARH